MTVPFTRFQNSEDASAILNSPLKGDPTDTSLPLLPAIAWKMAPRQEFGRKICRDSNQCRWRSTSGIVQPSSGTEGIFK
jgi:hypothetical protein